MRGRNGTRASARAATLEVGAAKSACGAGRHAFSGCTLRPTASNARPPSGRVTSSFINVEASDVRQVAACLGRLAAELWLRGELSVDRRTLPEDTYEQE
jgi:hypothetical protein